jgi:hypothetical protein
MLLRNLRAEADLLDQLVSSCEQRLARALLLLARYGKRCKRPKKVLPMMSQSTLAGIVGSTRVRPLRALKPSAPLRVAHDRCAARHAGLRRSRRTDHEHPRDVQR